MDYSGSHERTLRVLLAEHDESDVELCNKCASRRGIFPEG